MYELREYDRGSNHVHVWFQLHSIEEAIQVMLKRCFGKDNKIFKTQYGCTCCDMYEVPGNPMCLYQVSTSVTTKNSWYKKGLCDIYERDNTIGPSTEFVYEIWRS